MLKSIGFSCVFWQGHARRENHEHHGCKCAPNASHSIGFAKVLKPMGFSCEKWHGEVCVSAPISRAAELHIISTLRLERLWQSCNVLLYWRRNPFKGWAPGRAAQIRLERRRRHFSENVDHFSASCPDLSVLVNFSKTHSWTCHPHSWIHLDLV